MIGIKTLNRDLLKAFKMTLSATTLIAMYQNDTFSLMNGIMTLFLEINGKMTVFPFKNELIAVEKPIPRNRALLELDRDLKK